MARSAANEIDGPREREDANDVNNETNLSTLALSITGLTKRFGSGDESVLAVDDVSLDVKRGTVVGLLGPNGAGKTTLIKCALGIVLPDAGSVRVFGVDVGDGRRAAYADVDAMLEGARNDYWRLTVRENLRYFATIHGVDPNSVSARHDRLLERLDLTEKADTPVRDLSRGMKQKVSLASVLAGGADLVFLDEPTLGLDVESSRTLRRELRRLAHEEGLTIVLSSHDMDVIEDVCDRVVMMAGGRIVADDTVEALLSSATRETIRITSPDLDEAVVETLRESFAVRHVEDLHDTSLAGDHAHGDRDADAAVNVGEGVGSDGGVDRDQNLVEERRTVLEVDVAGDALYDLMETLREAGVTIETIDTVRPDLEEVFVDVTGMEAGAIDGRGRSP
ncbi:ABC-type transport system ATP-binding protein [Halalkaliarchaeum desulfuricum]|uniref:ABC-type transport system ATP-binding protein n=1 Tax=Halalkaliarchaeum desulfuricum TaxID=2055893 RepID=A0A343TLB5_9EURY|nr:ABC transporter ATP-binding protein [Halalkaliarchaeum desulfuricum]AUX09887.1 ABC-type transport system ATP-binding protein [Halalkaliarchaeum desulfuricum]